MVKGGILVAAPFKTSDKPFVKSYPSSIYAGKVDPILNPPGGTTEARRQFSSKSITPQTAGTTHKISTAYSPNAARNRVRNDAKRIPPPFESTLDICDAMTPRNRFRTISGVSLASSKVPMAARLGFTNADITSRLAKDLHGKVYAS